MLEVRTKEFLHIYIVIAGSCKIQWSMRKALEFDISRKQPATEFIDGTVVKTIFSKLYVAWNCCMKYSVKSLSSLARDITVQVHLAESGVDIQESFENAFLCNSEYKVVSVANSAMSALNEAHTWPFFETGKSNYLCVQSFTPLHFEVMLLISFAKVPISKIMLVLHDSVKEKTRKTLFVIFWVLFKLESTMY